MYKNYTIISKEVFTMKHKRYIYIYLCTKKKKGKIYSNKNKIYIHTHIDKEKYNIKYLINDNKRIYEKWI